MSDQAAATQADFPRVANADPELAALLAAEERRQSDTLTLIASENHCSTAVREACSSILTDKYAEGYPTKRYYGGCEVADEVEELARKRACQLFGVEHANVQPHSGTNANLAVLEALAGPNGKILGMALAEGGHLSHGHRVSASGKLFTSAQYGVDAETGLINYDRVRDLALALHPKIIIAGASSYPRAIDYRAFREIADEVDAILMADIAHPAGLIAAGVMESPVGQADVITMTTHKTLRGPRGGLILCKPDYHRRIDSAVFPGGQGGPLMHQIAGKAMAFGEALRPEFVDYQTKVLAHARFMATALADRGLRIVTGGTDSHMLVVDLRGHPLTGADVETRCLEAGLSLNKNMVPGDPRPPFVTSGIRIGTSAATTRGLGEAEFAKLAEILVDIIDGGDPKTHKPEIDELCRNYPLPD